MVTYYNKKDMISFAQWVLSEERKRLRSEDEIVEQSNEVFNADVESWMKRQK